MFPDLETCFTHYYRDPIVTIIRRVPPLPDLSRGEKWIAGKRIRRREVVWIVSRFMNISDTASQLDTRQETFILFAQICLVVAPCVNKLTAIEDFTSKDKLRFCDKDKLVSTGFFQFSPIDVDV